MDPIFNDFIRAHTDGNGYDLSLTLSPIPPSNEPNRLRAFYRSTNFSSVQKDFQYRILWDKPKGFEIHTEEGNGWVEVFVAYWKAIGEIVKAEEASRTNSKVREMSKSFKMAKKSILIEVQSLSRDLQPPCLIC